MYVSLAKLVDVLHEFFGGGQIAVSDFLDKNDVIAVDYLKNNNKTHLLVT